MPEEELPRGSAIAGGNHTRLFYLTFCKLDGSQVKGCAFPNRIVVIPDFGPKGYL